MTARAEVLAGQGGQRTTPPIALIALIFVVALLSLYGAELAVGAFGVGASQPGAPAVGESIPTSFGSITVETVQTIDGLTSKDMWSGMTHGIQSLVQADEAQVAVAVYLANDGARAVPVDAGQLRVVVEGRAEEVVPTGTTILPLLLQPGSGVRGTFTFVVPLGGANASIVYLDPGGPPVTLLLGRLDQPPVQGPGHIDATDHDE